MNYKKAKELTDRLTPINCVKLALYAAELVYPIYKKYDENDTVVIAAINAARKYIENPCKETQDAAWSATDAAYTAADAAWLAADAACAAKDADWSATNAAHAAADAAHSAADADWSALRAVHEDWSAADVAWLAVDAACADDTIEAKIRDYAAKLIKEQGE